MLPSMHLKACSRCFVELMYIQKNDQDSVSNSAVLNGFAAAGDGTVEIHDVGAS
ncbi:MAG: hypothetical protein U0586_04235 [Candidatus Brocadiaceae bacterium]